jgi:predicted lipase
MRRLRIGNNSATGFVASDHTKKKIVISLRGSVSLSNWIADIKFVQKDCPMFGRGAACSIGFLGFWEQCRPEAMKGLLAALQENPTYGLVVTGHSLGGAAAVYAAGELRLKYKDVEMVCYPFFASERSQSYT